MARAEPTSVLVHADESCLGNGTEPPNPGGNAALIEAPAGDSVARWDFYECSPDTTNNKMALAGAIAALEWPGRVGVRRLARAPPRGGPVHRLRPRPGRG